MVAILSTAAIPEVRMTVDEYLAADLPEGYRYELVDGVVEISPTPSLDHDHPVSYLHEAFVLHRQIHRGEIAHISQRAGVVIPEKPRVREPDLAIYRSLAHGDRGPAVWKENLPFLVVEVLSPGQQHRDFVDKRDDYWTAGIEEYWVVDPIHETLTVLSRGAKAWDEQVYRKADDVYTTPRLSAMEIQIGALFSH